mgnify:CR=1 FL=1
MPALVSVWLPFRSRVTGVGALIAQDQHHAMAAHAASAAGTAGLFEGPIFFQPGTGTIAKNGGQRTGLILLQRGDIAVIQLFLSAFHKPGVAQRGERLRRELQ